jgi:hypothetical protein
MPAIPYRAGVYGFVETPQGDVLAFGGTLHFVISRGFVARVSAAGASPLYEAQRDLSGEVVAETSPHAPISHVVPATNGEGWIAFAFNQLFQCDVSFAKCTNFAELHVDIPSGRPDAVGSYPGVAAAHRFGDRIVLSTRRNGVVELKERVPIDHALPGELPVRPEIVRVWRGGIAAWNADEESSVFGYGRWGGSLLPLPPEIRALPRERRGRYSFVSLNALPDGRAFVLATYEPPPNEARNERSFISMMIADGRVLILANESNKDWVAESPQGVFLLSDGRPALSGADGKLWTFTGSGWIKDDPARRLPVVSQWLVQRGPRWLVAVPGESWGKPSLQWIEPESRQALSPSPLSARLGDRAVEIESAAVWDEEHLLVATNPVLCLLDISSGECSPFAPRLSEEARRIVRSSTDTLWVAGRSLWRIDQSKDQILAHEIKYPFLQDTDVLDIEATDGRLVLALGARGLVVINTNTGAPLDQPVSPSGWDGRQPHEPRYGDGAVFVDFDISDIPDSNQRERRRLVLEFRNLEVPLLSDARTSGLRAYAADERGFPEKNRIAFYSPEPDALAARVVSFVARHPLARRMRVSKRLGPRGFAATHRIFPQSSE